MDILIAVGLTLLGIILIVWGADRLTDGAVGIAERLNIPQFIIGLTIVAMGTSAPELFVSLMSAFKNTPDLAVGNVVGSNIFNVLVIVGITAIVCPMKISKNTVKKDIPIVIISSLALVFMCRDKEISRLDAAILFVAFVLFLIYTVKETKKEDADVDEQKRDLPIWKSTVFIILGLVCLVGGGDIFVDGATQVAKFLGVSDAIIGLTIVAGGTSLPELATSIVAARKGNSAIAIGNVIGSCLFNILMIIGITGLVSPFHIADVTVIDYGAMTVSVFLLWLFSYTKYTVEKWEGIILFLCYIAYLFAILYV